MIGIVTIINGNGEQLNVGEKVAHVRKGGHYTLTKFELNSDGVVMAELEGMEAVDPDLYKPLEEEDDFRLDDIQMHVRKAMSIKEESETAPENTQNERLKELAKKEVLNVWDVIEIANIALKW
jgi:hypothetical protein